MQRMTLVLVHQLAAWRLSPCMEREIVCHLQVQEDVLALRPLPPFLPTSAANVTIKAGAFVFAQQSPKSISSTIMEKARMLRFILIQHEIHRDLHERRHPTNRDRHSEQQQQQQQQ